MVPNSLPPGTKVRFLRPVGKVVALETASYIGLVGRSYTERPEDEIEVMHGRDRVVVQRRDIEKV